MRNETNSQAFRAGFHDGIPIGLGYFAVAFALGVAARDAGMTVHLRELCGENAHHILEATFKAFARALRAAVESDPRVEGIPSTKGVL